ncbi:MAG: Rieske (2Fe-2S) protein [Gemmatimonadota bacterium]
MKALPQHPVSDVSTPPDRATMHPCVEAGVDNCIDRREFLATGGLFAVGALLAGACGDGQIGGSIIAPGGNGEITVTLADYPDLVAVGAITRINGLSRPVALVRASATAYRAFSMVCTHQGTTIDVVGGTSFRCPNHGASFAATGQWTGGERTTNLVELPLVPTADGTAVTISY